MRRREFVALLGSATATMPLTAWAQQPKMPVVGLLRSGSAGENPSLMAAFHLGLRETGYVENQNVVVEYRYTDGRNDRLPALLSDLLSRQVAVIAVPGSTAAALAAKAATQKVPIVFMMGGDPIEFGLVSSLARPGGNVTGVAQLMVPVIAKRLELLHQLVPDAQTIALLLNPTNPFSEAERREVQAAVNALQLKLQILYAQNADEIDVSFLTLKAQGVHALLLGADVYFLNQRIQIAALAARYAVPTISHYREYTEAGGLISYGNNLVEANRLTGIYVGRILGGESPKELPVLQPTKFDFVINLKVATALGLAIPDRLLALANDVIE
jgi:putative tryptophan/tyrosine transport system substrate-binding protein